MEAKVKRPLAILNLTENLSEDLRNYFAQKGILLSNQEDAQPDQVWSHIITEGEGDFTPIKNKFETTQKDIRIISLTSVEDLQNFAGCNGKLVLDQVWMKSPMGGFIMDKFLQEYGGIALGDNYPAFKEKGSFNITNPFNTGEYLDRLVQSAFLEGVSGLAIKTFFDHLVMYLTGLKTKGKLGMPIEVAYGYFDDIFGVQLNFYTKGLSLEDVTASLSNNISKKAEEYLLNVAIKSSDFFDFTSLVEVDKTVITGLWSKSESIKVENRGFLFNQLNASAGLTNYPSEGVTSYQMSETALQDYSDRVVLSSPASEAEVVTTVSGGTEEDLTAQVVKGAEKPVAETVEVIHGTDMEEELIRVVKGNVEKEEESYKISGSKNFDVDKFAFRVSAGVDEKVKGGDSLKIRSLKNELPAAIKSGFEQFTLKLGKKIEDVTNEDLRLFKEVKVPEIIMKTAIESDQKSVKADPALTLENESLKNKLKVLMTEVKILKDSKTSIAEILVKSHSAAEAVIAKEPPANHTDIVFKAQVIQKFQEKKPISEVEMQKMANLMERESKLLTDAKALELDLKKLQLENLHKETFYNQELEKLNRNLKAKDLIVTKTKEGMTKLMVQKDSAIAAVTEKLVQVNKTLANSQSQSQVIQIRELERKALNAEKMNEIYKAQIAQKPAVKVEDEAAKEENRKLTMLLNQMKNQMEQTKKESLKLQERSAQDQIVLNTLRNDKVKLEDLLKKSLFEVKKEDVDSLKSAHQDEMKKVQAKYELVELQFKEVQTHNRDMEVKLHELMKSQKKEAVVDEVAATRGKTAHLEGNVRKLTQDLVESRNQLAEMKKETNKLRQEKTALQNQIDKMKKDADKALAALPKKPAPGGKAA